MKRYEQLPKLVAFVKPKRIIEIGTHRGTTADLICREALKHNEKVEYTGYDLFEDATKETNERELNGKGAGSIAEATEVFEAIKAEFPGFTYELVRGDTRITLHGTEQRADFVFLDGGHSVETIRGDYEAVKGSRLIVFDDYYVGSDTTDKFGCNTVLPPVHEVLPVEDRFKKLGFGIRLAVVGYSSKWEAAIRRVCKKDGHKTVSLWRGGDVESADLLCAINVFERGVIEPDESLEVVRRLVGKRLFFVIAADAIRSLDYWRTKLEKYFQILEWFAPNGNEVVGTAMPLLLVGEWNAKGVLDDDERFEHTKANCAVISKRFRPPLTDAGEPIINDRRAVIVGFGPSLQDTWPNIMGEKRLSDCEADIVSMSGSHDFLLRRGVVPDYHVECDPRAHKALNINAPHDAVKYYIASCCHPDLIEKLRGRDVTLWHLMNGQASYRIGEDIESERNEVMICGGGSVGLRSIALFYALGYRKFSIYGMDCSFSRGLSKEQAHDMAKEDVRQWAGFHKGKKKTPIAVGCAGKWFVTSPVDVTYTRHFFDTVQRSDGANFNIYGDGLLQEMCKQQKQETKAA